MSHIKLYNGNSLQIMKNLQRESNISLVLTDPPYGTTSCKWDIILPFDEMWNCLLNITQNNTPILLFGQEPFSSLLRISNLQMYKYDWVWHKNKPSGFANAKYKPMCNHELISVFYKEKPKYYPIKEERDLKPKYNNLKQGFERHGNYGSETQGVKCDNQIKKYSGLRNPTSIKKFDVVPNNKGSRVHPTQKPIELLEYLIKTYTDEGDTVLDFTMGLGSTGVACKNLNRNFIGIELDKNYFDIACKRLNYTK